MPKIRTPQKTTGNSKSSCILPTYESRNDNEPQKQRSSENSQSSPLALDFLFHYKDIVNAANSNHKELDDIVTGITGPQGTKVAVKVASMCIIYALKSGNDKEVIVEYFQKLLDTVTTSKESTDCDEGRDFEKPSGQNAGQNVVEDAAVEPQIQEDIAPKETKNGFKCPNCSYERKEKWNVKRHIKLKACLHICDICQKDCKTKKKLNKHLQYHNTQN